ncbi:MAG TPA: LodA/GoxA family CTQ-dependent oxidase [Thermoanaerobaculia bacterium]|jgi:hypothetical protein|nr:LodA/GoxA family CTQ-dependent oxidase [Thermoanaerobaculia bacterium]
MDLTKVKYCRIHPAVGIARVGGSEEGYFIGPEVPNYDGTPPAGGWKDEDGQLLRQVARFRVYGYDANGNVLGEVLPGDGVEMTWSAHVANSKAAWYDFDEAMDIPSFDGSQGTAPKQSGLRNANAADRAQLVIDPGPREISGRKTQGKKYAFTGGKFFGKEVPLGELRTDDAGRLLFFPAHGHSASRSGDPATTFANNTGWHDDIADGPVQATVTIKGRPMSVEHAWVVVAPPDYAPGVMAVVTMYDVIAEASAQIDPSVQPRVPSFTRHVAPTFIRLAQNQWVNAGFGKLFGFDSPLDLEDLLPTLGDNSEFARPLREQLFARFRSPDYRTMEPDAIPPVYGDSTNIPATDPRQWYAVTAYQYDILRRWAAGEFAADWTGAKAPRRLEEYPVAEQPWALDYSALENTIGGPFHPGCEMTWPMRQPILYQSAFRLKLRRGPAPDYGPYLNSRVCLGAGGPLDGSGPGDVSRWMAVPWQTDTSSCLYAYTGWQDGVFLPTFWPVRVPNTVLTDEQYAIVNDPAQPYGDRFDAFKYDNRQYWLRALPPRENYKAVINTFVTQWNEVGVVTRTDGPADKKFPSPLFVEMGMNVKPPAKKLLALAAEGAVEERAVDAGRRPENLPNPRRYR